MDEQLLNQCLKNYFVKLSEEPTLTSDDINNRTERKRFYQSYSGDRITGLSEDDFFEYLSKLWAMQFWNNKKYKVEKIIGDNGFQTIKDKLQYLLYGEDPVNNRWDDFNRSIKGFGSSMMSELLCYVHPNDCMVWNSTAAKAYRNLGISVPRHDYQVTGDKYLVCYRYKG